MNPNENYMRETPLHLNESLKGSSATSRERTKEIADKRKNAKKFEPSQASGNVSEERDTVEDSEGSNTLGRHDNDVAIIHRRQRTSNRKIADRISAHGNDSRISERSNRQEQEATLPSQIVNDGWRLAKTAVRLPMLLYPIWKWFFLGYLVWLAITYLMAFLYRSATAALAPVCSWPIIGPQIPFCTMSFEPRDRPIDVSKVATSQDVLTVVMDRVGQNFDIAKDMVGHEFAVRDLRIRVAASNLSRKRELTRELETLVRHTKQTAK